MVDFQQSIGAAGSVFGAIAAFVAGPRRPPPNSVAVTTAATEESLVLHDIQIHDDGVARGAIFEGSLLMIGDDPYTTKTEAKVPCLSRQHSSTSSGRYRPVTVVDTDTPDISSKWLFDKLDSFLQRDDVLSTPFLDTIIIRSNVQQGLVISPEIVAAVTSRKVSLLYLDEKAGPVADIQEGPHFLTDTYLFPALRLFHDTQEAFVITPHLSLPGWGPRKGIIKQNWPGMVAVPSRLGYAITDEKPLAGLRVGVKDVIDLEGYRTGASSRAYTSFYPPKQHSAPVVQELLDLGAIIIGKTKTTQFARGEEPTADWVDYHCPWNPRGDGYQTPEGSSAGSAAAIAAYDWLDLALGTDTSGSVRLPAAFQGVFGFRPSTRLLSQSGTVVVAQELDTPGYLSRDLSTISQALLSVQSMRTIEPSRSWKRPTRLIYPLDHFPFPQAEAQEILESFIQKLESYLSFKRTPIDLNALWLESNEVDTKEGLSEYLGLVLSTLINSGSLHNLSKFVTDYTKKEGRKPFISPFNRWAWEYGAKLTPEEIAESGKRKNEYKEWVSKQLLSTADGLSSDSIMIFPFGDPEPRYRDAYRDEPGFGGYSWRSDFYSPLAELPDLVVPIGQYAYQSRITGHTEYLPVNIAIVGAKGCDGMLVQFVEDMLRETGTKSKVQTGREPFPREGA